MGRFKNHGLVFLVLYRNFWDGTSEFANQWQMYLVPMMSIGLWAPVCWSERRLLQMLERWMMTTFSMLRKWIGVFELKRRIGEFGILPMLKSIIWAVVVLSEVVFRSFAFCT